MQQTTRWWYKKTTRKMARLPPEPKESEKHPETDKTHLNPTPTTTVFWSASQKKLHDNFENLPAA
jgi:hypothetical protein